MLGKGHCIIVACTDQEGYQMIIQVFMCYEAWK